MRLRIDEVGGQEQRFRVSSEPDFAVLEDQLIPDLVKATISEKGAELISGTGKFVISFNPFRIQSFVEEKLVMTLNENDTLYFE